MYSKAETKEAIERCLLFCRIQPAGSVISVICVLPQRPKLLLFHFTSALGHRAGSSSELVISFLSLSPCRPDISGTSWRPVLKVGERALRATRAVGTAVSLFLVSCRCLFLNLHDDISYACNPGSVFRRSCRFGKARFFLFEVIVGLISTDLTLVSSRRSITGALRF